MKEMRDYKAFISYRHCPLDIRVAEALHKKIERYRIPRDLRENGQKHLGLAFRDKEELPLSSNLTEDIYDALDQAEFLIVVCTPETPKSKWVRREIQYFIEKHGRDRVLTVLAAGTPEESIPKAVTQIYAEDGETVIEEIEPLCAYLVDENGDEERVLKNLDKEFLRLAAAMLDCHYDALVQRQKRYRAQQITYAAAAVTAVALLFAGMLVNRNQQITRKNQEILEKNEEIRLKNEEVAQQLLLTQINESKALTLLSRQQLENGDRLGAIESALNALPHDGDDRPYYAAAEGALAEALNIYGHTELDYYLTITNPQDIYRLELTEDGKYLVTLDTLGNLRCFDTETTEMLWETEELTQDWESEPVYDTLWETYTEDLFVKLFEVVDELGIVMYSDRETTYAFSLETGELLYSVPFFTAWSGGSISDNQVVLSPDGKSFAQYSKPKAEDFLTNWDGVSMYTHFVEIYDTKTGQYLHDHTCNWPESWDVTLAFSQDGSRLAVVFAGGLVEVLVLETENWETVYQTVIEPAEEEWAWDAYSVWLPGNELLLSYEQRETSENIYFYMTRLAEDGTAVAENSFYIYTDGYSSKITHYLTDTHVYYDLGKEYLCAVELETLDKTMSKLEATAGNYLRADGSMMSVQKDGWIGYRKAQYKSYTSHIYQPDRELRLAAGVAGGKEVLCLVPNDEPHTVLILTEPYLQETVPVEAPPMEEYGSWKNEVWYLDFLVSPSGREIFAFDNLKDYSNTEAQTAAVAVTVYDAQTLEVTDWFTITGTEDYYALSISSTVGFSADETKLILEGMVYDRVTGKTSRLEDGDELYGEYGFLADVPAFYTQPAGAPLLSAYKKSGTVYWWTDGADRKSTQIPYTMETYNSGATYAAYHAIGHNGLYVLPLFEDQNANRTEAFGIYSTKDGLWQLLENPVDKAGFPSFAIGSVTDQVVFADMDRTLRVYDFGENAVVATWPLTVPANSILEMQLIGEDRYLAITTLNYQMYVIDLLSGAELGPYDVGASTTPVVDDGKLYLNYVIKSQFVDLESGEILGRFDGMFCYLKVDGRAMILRQDTAAGLEAMPLYNWEELSQMGWQLLAKAKREE